MKRFDSKLKNIPRPKSKKRYIQHRPSRLENLPIPAIGRYTPRVDRASEELLLSHLSGEFALNMTLIEFYQQLWDEREHVSFVSGLPIYQIELSVFAHVLAKAQSRYPKFKFYKPNVVLLTPEEHFLLDMGSMDQRLKYAHAHPGCNWGKIFVLAEQLKEEYKLL